MLGKRNDDGELNYKIIKTYHRLEKSLSFKNRNRNSGWSAAFDCMELISSNTKKDYTYQQRVGVKVLRDFYADSDQKNDRDQCIKNFIDGFGSDQKEVIGGVKLIDDEYIARGKLQNPEDFFNTRYSVRNFSTLKVEELIINRAMKLASKTPSVCNRQAWSIYHIENEDVIQQALKYQNGNKGFGSNIKNLLVVATDLKAFEGPSERYQNWIDGGLYAMSIAYAFHALGISTCMLNLSNSPSVDMRLRRVLNAKREHTFIMMIAIGYAETGTKVCVSARNDIEEYYQKI